MENNSGIRPTGHYILVLPDPVETKTAGGIILVDETVENAQRDTTVGTLIEVGAIGWEQFGGGEPWAKVGDKVSYGKYAGRDMTGMDDKQYVIMNCEDILAVLSD